MKRSGILGLYVALTSFLNVRPGHPQGSAPDGTRKVCGKRLRVWAASEGPQSMGFQAHGFFGRERSLPEPAGPVRVKGQIDAAVEEAVMDRGRFVLIPRQEEELRALGGVECRLRHQHPVIPSGCRERGGEETPPAWPFLRQRAEVDTRGRVDRDRLSLNEPCPERLYRLLRTEEREKPQPGAVSRWIGVRFPGVGVDVGREARCLDGRQGNVFRAQAALSLSAAGLPPAASAWRMRLGM